MNTGWTWAYFYRNSDKSKICCFLLLLGIFLKTHKELKTQLIIFNWISSLIWFAMQLHRKLCQHKRGDSTKMSSWERDGNCLLILLPKEEMLLKLLPSNTVTNSSRKEGNALPLPAKVKFFRTLPLPHNIQNASERKAEHHISSLTALVLFPFFTRKGWVIHVNNTKRQEKK